MTSETDNRDATPLLIISDNQLFAEATGLTVRDRRRVSAFQWLPGVEQLELCRGDFPSPGVLLLDLEGQDDPADVSATVHRVIEAMPGWQVATIGYDAEIEVATACIEAGANAFISKTQPLDQLVDAIDALRDGRSICPAAITQAVLDRIRVLSLTKTTKANNGDADLTEREAEILRLVDRGLLNKEIAKHLGIAISTVKNHLHSAFEKLAVDSRKQAVQQALALGVISCQSPSDQVVV